MHENVAPESPAPPAAAAVVPDVPGVPAVPEVAAHLDPQAWTMAVTDDGGEIYPFIEDEDANVTGFGHQDPAAFAAAVNRYDLECGAGPFTEDDLWDEDHVTHAWVTLDVDGERLHTVPEGTPDSFAVTGLWGQR